MIGSRFYALHDSNKKLGGAIEIDLKDAGNWNQDGYGIFQTVQSFNGPRRIENLTTINAWAVDIDTDNKEETLALINQGLVPSLIIESKNGYHVYWRTHDATQENWRLIMENRLIPFYSADKNAKDLARILRVPGYYHLKNPDDPFLVKKVFEQDVSYSEEMMFFFYKDLITPQKQKRLHAQTQRIYPMGVKFWERVWNLNCEYALTQLSGSPYVNNETYSFKRNPSGTFNILVNGNSSSCWIDQHGRIGSCDDGGPTIAQWLNWFHKDYKKVVKIIREVFPECQ